MIILDTGDKSLELVLGGAVTTNQLPWTTSFITIGDDESITPGNSYGLSNGGTAVTIVDAPDPTNDIQLKAVSVINKDTVNATVTIQLDDASIPTITPTIIVTLQPGDTLVYIDTIGWYVMDSRGRIRYIQWTPTLVGVDGQLPNAKGTLYTAVGNEKLVGITLVSSDGGSYNCNLYIKPGATSRRIIPFNKPVVDDLQFPFSSDIYHNLFPGTLIEGDAGTANKVDYIISIERQ